MGKQIFVRESKCYYVSISILTKCYYFDQMFKKMTKFLHGEYIWLSLVPPPDAHVITSHKYYDLLTRSHT